MANRVLGLAGRGKGPRVFTGNLGTPKVKIAGACETDAVIVRGQDFELEFKGCGVHQIPCSDYVEVEYHGEKFMICTLHAG